MSDGQHIPELVHLGSDPSLLVAAQHIAAKRLLDYDGEVYPRDGCAITLSVLLQEAGINLKDVPSYRARQLVAERQEVEGHCFRRPANRGRWFNMRPRRAARL